MSTPFFTVAIPAYNNLAYLKDAVKSVLNQSFKDFELVIIDDCSTENIWDYLQAIKDKRVRIFRNSINLGIVKNWRKCIEVAKGKWFKFLMADDVMFKDCLFILKSLIDKYPHNKVFVTSGIDFKCIDEIKEYLFNKNNRLLENTEKFLFEMKNIIKLRKKFIQTWAMPDSYTLLTSDLKDLIRENSYKEVENIFGKTGHCVDYYILYAIAVKHNTMFEIDMPLYGVRNHETNLSKTYSSDLLYHLNGDKYIHYKLYNYKKFEKMYIVGHAFKIYYNKIISNKKSLFNGQFFKWTYQLLIFLIQHTFGIKVKFNAD